MTPFEFAISQIEAYMQVHPNAADTQDGIDANWIAWPENSDPAATALAIQDLIARGVLEKYTIGTSTLYRRARS